MIGFPLSAPSARLRTIMLASSVFWDGFALATGAAWLADVALVVLALAIALLSSRVLARAA